MPRSKSYQGERPLIVSLVTGLLLAIVMLLAASPATAGWPGAKFIEFGQVRVPEAHLTAVQDDGKIVVAGYAQKGGWPNTRLIVTRLMPDGSFDPSFGRNGRAVVQSRGLWAFFDLQIQQDGGLVILGSGNNGIGIIRVNTNGTRDRTFGNGGVRRIQFMTNWAIPWGSITLDSEDGITYVGTSYRRVPRPFLWRKETVVWKLTAKGQRDRDFAGTGLVKRAGYWSRVNLAGFTQDDGSVLVVGAPRLSKKLVGDFAIFGTSLSKLKPNGKPDPSFGKNGILRLSGLYAAAPVGFKMKACSPVNALIDSLRRVVVLSNCLARKVDNRELHMMGALTRHLPDGSLDRTFARDGSQALYGRVSTMFSGIAEANNDGALTMTGLDINSNSTVLFRVDGNGEISRDFGPKGYRYYSKPNQRFSPGISVDDRGWTYAPITRYKDAKEEKDEKSWFGVVAIPSSGKFCDRLTKC